jgi:16S rRNA (cytosine1402-N4)-methyltransferase
VTAACDTRRPHASGVSLTPGHTPVLLDEVLHALAPRDGAIYVDGTLGGGGYTRALLEAADCTVWGIDRDPDAIARNAALAEMYAGRVHLVEGRFGDMHQLLTARGIVAVDGIALDLGVSSPQIDTPARGFSFMHDGPLDMRMARNGESAADIVNGAPEAELAGIIRDLGEERHARRVARAIAAARAEAPIETTGRLAEVVRRAIPVRGKPSIDSATRTFQALRIHVNDELGEIDRGLAAAENLLAPGGRLAVVSFHSLEDRRVKAFLRVRSGGEGRGSRHSPDQPVRHAPAWRLVSRRAIRPGDQEAAQNPRARSARLRVGERTAEPPWGSAAAGGTG